MEKYYSIILITLLNAVLIESTDVLGCGGFIKSHVQIDFSKIDIELHTKQGIVKDRTSCAPNNGYYFIPVYDKGEYILKLKPPAGWSFTPTTVSLNVDGSTDLCSRGKDINFVFKGFGITGKVENFDKATDGPAGITIELKHGGETHKTLTTNDGSFFFTPVYPGQYNIRASHAKWKFFKSLVTVQVAEGNTELVAGSLVIGGYDVSGYVKSENVPVVNVEFILFQHESNKSPVYIDGCLKEQFKEVSYLKAKQLCHVKSNSQGSFVFPTVSPGRYIVVPYYKGRNSHFSPTFQEVVVKDNSVVVPKLFEIVGFTIGGRVLGSKNGKPLKGAKIFLNDEQVDITREDGSFLLQKIKNVYRLHIKSDKVEFDTTTINVGPNLSKLPDYYPSKYEVCGRVLSEVPQTVMISSEQKTIGITTLPSDGEFCCYLTSGRYKIFVNVADHEKLQHIQFFPTAQTVEVTSSPISGILFSQLKALVRGKVVCLEDKDCSALQVTFKPINGDPLNSKELMVDVVDKSYIIEDVLPGTYEIFLAPNKLCWETDKYVVTINSANEVIQPFVHSGYPIMFNSSHSTKAYYKLQSSNSKGEMLDINRGKKSVCLKKSGVYDFELRSCHTYDDNIITFDTNSDVNEITLEAKKHSIIAAIIAQDIVNDLYITVNIGGVISEKGPLVYKDGQYLITLLLHPDESAEITPKSEILYFKPNTMTISGRNDCASIGSICAAVKGKVFKGKIVPPLAGVVITLKTEDLEPLIVSTDVEGKYKFSPQNQSKNFKISAKKNTYIFVGPNALGDFIAQKLAEVVVHVVDEQDESPLQGALLSLSGSKSYRSNLQTNKNGKIIFHSLSPSEYFLRPMMKEYSFDPSSKIINVTEGASVNVKLRGKRVAYSCFGEVTSLNGEPEERIVIVAEGLGNCSKYSEDANSESNGLFRIRGLHPYCQYNISVKGSLDENHPIERAVPGWVNLTITSNATNVKFTIFRPIPNTDVLVHVYTENTELYKQLRVNLYKETSPPTLIHTAKLDNSFYKSREENNIGVLIQLPSVLLNGLSYSIQLESTSSHLNKNSYVQYFVANSSFKYLSFKYSAKEATSEQNIKQTSLWALFLIFGTFIALYNLHELMQFLKAYTLKINLDSSMFNPLRRKSVSNDYVIDKNEIEQMVQNINAPKRKVKPRKA